MSILQVRKWPTYRSLPSCPKLELGSEHSSAVPCPAPCTELPLAMP